MTSYRNPNLIERYEDIVFELDTALNSNPANNASQKKKQVIVLLLITVENRPHLIGITPDSMSISIWKSLQMELMLLQMIAMG